MEAAAETHKYFAEVASTLQTANVADLSNTLSSWWSNLDSSLGIDVRCTHSTYAPSIHECTGGVLTGDRHPDVLTLVTPALQIADRRERCCSGGGDRQADRCDKGSSQHQNEGRSY